MIDLTYTYAHELKKIQKLKLFYIHVAFFLLINAILLIINLATNPNYLWFLWPLVFWTKGLVLHAFSTFDKAAAVSADNIEEGIFREKTIMSNR